MFIRSNLSVNYLSTKRYLSLNNYLLFRIHFILKLVLVLLIVLSVLTSCISSSQNRVLTSGTYRMDSLGEIIPMTVMWYNVENLFDTIDNPYKNDQEFLPLGAKAWHRYRYYQKLNHLSEVIASVPSDRLTSISAISRSSNVTSTGTSIGGDYWQMMPAVIGMCEVESEQCLNDLTNRTMLKQMHYRSIITQSSDARGINIALLYDPTKIRLVNSYCLSVDSTLQTRDILVAKMSVVYQNSASADSLYLLLNHWPSRRGGAKVSSKKRAQVESVLLNEIDKIREKNAKAKIVIMGDFNTYADSKELRLFSHDYSMYRIPTEPASSIHNKLFPSLGTPSKILCEQYVITGSYLYQGRWGSLDHFFVSSNLMHQVEYSTLFVRDWMIDKAKRMGGYQPRRTYLGPRYIGGYSDHLPLLLYLTL